MEENAVLMHPGAKKTVSIHVSVPAWVAYIAQELNGDWFGYEKKPTPKLGAWQTDGDCYFLAECEGGNPKWKDTLQKVA